MCSALSILFLVALPSQAYGAAHSSTAMSRMKLATTSQERDVLRDNLEQGRQAYLQAQDAQTRVPDAVAGSTEGESKQVKSDAATPHASPQAPSALKAFVSSLKDLALEQLQKNSTFQETFKSTASALVDIWTTVCPESDFQTLLARSHKAVETLYALYPTYPVIATLPSSTGGSLSLTRPLLHHEGVAQKLCDLSLFSSIGRWPVAPDIKTFSKAGYAAGDTKDCLYVVDCTHHAIISIDHEKTDSRIDKVRLLFSYDGAALARLVHRDALAVKPHEHFSVVIYATATGEPIYSVDHVGHNFSPSRALPFFTYTDDHDATVIYDYRTKKATRYSVIRPEERVLGHVAKISPQATFSFFVIKNPDESHDMYLHNNITRRRFFIQRLSDSRLVRAWESSVEFNSTESMMSLSDFYANTITLIKIDDLISDTPEIIPYLEIRECQSVQSPLKLQFSPDGMQALIPTKKNSATLYDLAKKTPLKIFNDTKNAQFLSNNVLLITNVADARGNSPELYLQDTRQTIPVGAYPEFSQEAMKVAYEKNGEYLCILDIPTRQESRIGKESQSKTCFFNNRGTLFCLDKMSIEQLMIDPTSCTLEQIFFLLGMARISQDGADKQEMYTQLLSSPILATFSKEVQASITTYLESQRVHLVAPAPDITSAKIKKEVD